MITHKSSIINVYIRDIIFINFHAHPLHTFLGVNIFAIHSFLFPLVYIMKCFLAPILVRH